MNFSSTEMTNFNDFMLFFEYSKYLKDNSVVKRGLVVPDLTDLASIRKRVSSVMLKGIRSNLALDIGAQNSNNLQTIICDKVSRNRSNSRGDYYTYNSKHSMKVFVPRERQSDQNANVGVITNTAHKIKLLEALVPENISPELLRELSENYEIAFTPAWNTWDFNRNLIDRITTISEEIRREIIEDIGDLAGARPFSILNAEVNEARNYTHNNGSYYFRMAGAKTLEALMNKYVKNQEVRVPSITWSNNRVPLIQSSGVVREIIDSNNNWVLGTTANLIGGNNRNAHHLCLCKRHLDVSGSFLAPNLFAFVADIKWKFSDEIIRRPEVFMDSIKKFNQELNVRMIGDSNE